MKQLFLFFFLISFFFSNYSFSQTAEVYKSDAIGAEGQEEFKLAAEKYAAAAKAYQAMNQPDTLCIYKAGANYFIAKQYTLAIPFLQQAIAMNYNLKNAYSYLSKTYLKLKETDKAESTLEKAIKNDPENKLDYESTLAYLYFNTQQYAKAQKAFKQLSIEIPDQKSYAYLYGFSLERTKHYAEALDVFQTIHKNYPDDKRTSKMVGICLFEKTDALHQQTLDSYKKKKAAGKATLDDYVINNRQLKEIDKGYDTACQMLEQSLQDFPSDKMIIASLYKIYTKQHKNTKATEMKAKL